MYLRKMFAATCLCAWCELRYCFYEFTFIRGAYNFHCGGIIKYSLIKYLLKMKRNYHTNKEKTNLKIKILCHILFFEQVTHGSNFLAPLRAVKSLPTNQIEEFQILSNEMRSQAIGTWFARFVRSRVVERKLTVLKRRRSSFRSFTYLHGLSSCQNHLRWDEVCKSIFWNGKKCLSYLVVWFFIKNRWHHVLDVRTTKKHASQQRAAIKVYVDL